jgi:hypothetical protein
MAVVTNSHYDEKRLSDIFSTIPDFEVAILETVEADRRSMLG